MLFDSRLKTALVAGVVAMGVTVPAQAAIIDFTDDIWTTAMAGDTASKKTRSIGAFGDVTIEAFLDENTAGTLTFLESVPGNPALPCGFLACDHDGAGIGDDEVTFGVGKKEDVERLKVTIENAFTLGRIHFLDLFAAGANASDPLTETAQFQINGNGGPGGVLDGTALDNVGYAVTGDLGIGNVTMIEVFADTFRASSSSNTDFALAAIESSSVPEPLSLGLMGLGLAGIGAFARRRHA